MQAKTRAKIDSDAACLPGKSERIELGSGTIRGGFEVAHHPGVNGAQVMGVMSACSIHESQRIETGLGKEVALVGGRIFDYKSVIKDLKE